MEETNQVEKWLRDLSQKGWKLSDHLSRKSDNWCLEQNGNQIYVNLNPYWLSLTLPISDHDKTNYRRYLELCHRYFMVKFSLAQSEQILLQIELPRAGLERSHCHKAVEALSVYLDRESHKQLQVARVDSKKTNSNKVSNKVRSLRELEVFPQESLVQYFQAIEHLGWGLRDDLKENRWKAIYKGIERSFDVHLYFNSYWVYFRVPILTENSQVKSVVYPENKAFLAPYLLQLNEQIYWIKFGLYEEEQILMMLDIPLEMFDLDKFRFATKTLANYADRLAYDIQVMANLHREEQLTSLMLKLPQAESPLVDMHKGEEKP